jgi:hypothetical protein
MTGPRTFRDLRQHLQKIDVRMLIDEIYSCTIDHPWRDRTQSVLKVDNPPEGQQIGVIKNAPSRSFPLEALAQTGCQTHPD